ncbi:Flap endonuclease 1-A [Invertebrate iridescent virus 30]|uniref:Flap endonuclease 1-A n=1 Tax=Invertebrate iridescent virus 30 TaxID=345585 RepID=W8W2H9_9VIRU|nr:Flap endonuclease 1-A [Invertebrate iridescent virus 30]CCV02235.1 Flap endonuclease 1-A [Invertebrate iridescent virus 30]
MGIKNLSQFLKKREVFETLDISTLKFMKLGIDAPMFLFKFKGVTDPSTQDWLQCFITFIAFLRKWDIHPIFIFEGKAPPEKAPAQEERRIQRQKMTNKTEMIEHDLNLYIQNGTLTPFLNEIWNTLKSKSKSLLKNKALTKSKIFIDIESIKEEIERRKRYEIIITSEDISNLKELLDIMGVSWIQSKGEAETDCVTLFYDNCIDYIVSEDTDVLAYFDPKNSEKELKVINNFNTTDLTFTQVSKNKILSTIGLSSSSFRDFCIMCGTDYNKNIARVGVETAYKFITKMGCIENVPLDTSILNYKRVRKIFEVTSNPLLHPFVKWCRLPEKDFIDNLNLFIFTHNLKNVDYENIFKVMSEPDIEF